jgi:hypothetical protein
MQTWPTRRKTFFDQALVAGVKRLVTADEQRRRPLRIEGRP